MIFVTVISVSLIMLMIQVFKTVDTTDSLPITESPQTIELRNLGLSVDELIIQNLNWTIDCDTMDLDNLIVYLNGLPEPEYNNVYGGYYRYYYEYDCGKQLLWLNISSQYPILVGIDLQIGEL